MRKVSLLLFLFLLFFILFTLEIMPQSIEPLKVSYQIEPKNPIEGKPFKLKYTIQNNSNENIKFRMSVRRLSPEESFISIKSLYGNYSETEILPNNSITGEMNLVDYIPGEKEYGLSLGNGIEITKIKLSVQPVKLSTPPEEIKEFLAWMKKSGYTDEIIYFYQRDLEYDEIKKFALDLIQRHKNKRLNSKENKIIFYDVISEDENAINSPVTSTDIQRLASYFSRLYGVPYTISRKEISIKYLNEFKPWNLVEKEGKVYLDLQNNQHAFERKIDSEHREKGEFVIVHWALSKIRIEGKEVLCFGRDMTGSGPACSNLDLSTWKNMTYYTHEHGHDHGLPHPLFKCLEASSPYKYYHRWQYLDQLFGLDCIMGASGYIPPDSNAFHLERFVNPLYRYCLEPEGGYQDSGKYGYIYSTLMKHTQCFMVKKGLPSDSNDTNWGKGIDVKKLLQESKVAPFRFKELFPRPWRCAVANSHCAGNVFVCDLLYEIMNISSITIPYVVKVKSSNSIYMHSRSIDDFYNTYQISEPTSLEKVLNDLLDKRDLKLVVKDCYIMVVDK